MNDNILLDVIRRDSFAFVPEPDGLQPLVDAIGNAKVVLIGEATHGTHEFYNTRAELTKALVQQKGFNFIAVEADWPDAYRTNRWVRGASADHDAEAALGDFLRFPRWMWRNRDVVDFLGWLRAHNDARPAADRVGFYGLDLYSMHRSIEAVLGYLRAIDPPAAARAQERYSCFETFGDDPQAYGYASRFGLTPGCEDEVMVQLEDLRRKAFDYANRDGRVAAEEYFFAEQNARLVANAETYYRAMFGGRAQSWNIRDEHMMETLESLLTHFGPRARAVVWAHNSHLGDARATQMSAGGELNLGQLVRERLNLSRHSLGEGGFLIGFTTHEGTVTAAHNWDDPAGRRHVRPSLAGSYERLFHDAGLDKFLLLLRDGPASDALRDERLERAIGVIYRPETERGSHYFRAKLSEQFDAVLHIDITSALEPLERWSIDEVDAPETYPSGL
jgi:erythromycin esterase-like protein